MGNVHAYRGRLTPALILMALVALAVVALGLAAAPANATSSWTCNSCHNYSSGDAFHAKAPHAGAGCPTCHTTGFASPAPSACASCHGGASGVIGAQTLHATAGCGTTNGCHGYTSPTPTPTPTATATATPTPTATATPTPTATATPTPTPTATVVATTVTAKVAPTITRLGRTVKTTGVVTPVATIAGKKVSLRVDFKKGTRWVKTKTASVTVTAAGAYSWKYKPLKRGTFRVRASIAATATYKASKTAYKTFKVR